MRRFAERDKHRRELRIHDMLQTGSVCERQRTVGCTGHIPEHADGPSEYRETKDIGEVKLNGCQSGTDVHACIDKVLAGQAGRTKTTI